MCVTPTEQPRAKEEETIKQRLDQVFPQIGRFPSLKEVYLKLDRWIDLYRRLQLPWLLLVWMLCYPIRDSGTEDADADDSGVGH